MDADFAIFRASKIYICIITVFYAQTSMPPQILASYIVNQLWAWQDKTKKQATSRVTKL